MNKYRFCSEACYSFEPTAMTAYDAHLECALKKGRLAVVNSAAMASQMMTFSGGADVWIGKTSFLSVCHWSLRVL